MTFLESEPTFPSKSNSVGRDLSSIAEDRYALGSPKNPWANDPDQARALALGLSMARHSFIIATNSTVDFSQQKSWAFPFESILALAGKASGKKILLELASRPSAASPWIGVAGKRILKHCLGNANFGYDKHFLPADPAAESFFHQLGHSAISTPFEASTAFLCQSALPIPHEGRAFELLRYAFGDEFYEMPSQLSTLEQMRLAFDWASSRAQAIELRQASSIPCIAARKPPRI